MRRGEVRRKREGRLQGQEWQGSEVIGVSEVWMGTG